VNDASGTKLVQLFNRLQELGKGQCWCVLMWVKVACVRRVRRVQCVGCCLCWCVPALLADPRSPHLPGLFLELSQRARGDGEQALSRVEAALQSL
jgi:hypothetical protein